jgi:fructose-1,6-bisphosphatase-3
LRWTEEKNPYYSYYNDEGVCERILEEFGLKGPHCHIINGHVPVKSKDGENPIKAHGRLIVIDGGFCRAYQPTTGIAGYTRLYPGIRICRARAVFYHNGCIEHKQDIFSTTVCV